MKLLMVNPSRSDEEMKYVFYGFMMGSMVIIMTMLMIIARLIQDSPRI